MRTQPRHFTSARGFLIVFFRALLWRHLLEALAQIVSIHDRYKLDLGKGKIRGAFGTPCRGPALKDSLEQR